MPNIWISETTKLCLKRMITEVKMKFKKNTKIKIKDYDAVIWAMLLMRDRISHVMTHDCDCFECKLMDECKFARLLRYGILPLIMEKDELCGEWSKFLAYHCKYYSKNE